MLGLSMTKNNPIAESQNKQIISVFELEQDALSQLPRIPGWCDLDDRGLIRVSGEEAEIFLQGQLTQDMALIKKGHSFLGAHCTPKGRILYLFRCFYWKESFYLDLPNALEASALKRLTMYKLRAKAQLESAATQMSRTALWGETMQTILQNAGWSVPNEPGASTQLPEGLLTCMDAGHWLLLSEPDYAQRIRSSLSQESPSDQQNWIIEQVRAAQPEVVAETSDTWIPQMLNLDHLQGVSFKKGCYTGQEIVARAHFLGKVKRRMRILGYEGEGLPSPGQKLHLNSDTPEIHSHPHLVDIQRPTEGEEESADSLQVVRAVELKTGQGLLLGVTKISQAPEEIAGE